MSKHGSHHKKGHIRWRDIDLFLEDKLEKRELKELKDKFKHEILQEKLELKQARSTEENFVYEEEIEEYMEKYEEQKKILDALKLIFPEDKELKNMLIKVE